MHKYIYSFLFLLLGFNLHAQNTWQRVYGGSGDDQGHSILQAFDGTYVIAGQTTSSGAGSADIMLIKVDTLGNKLWSYTYGGSAFDGNTGVDMIEAYDSSYLIVSRTQSFGSSGWDIYILKVDTGGTLLWSKKYGGNGNDNGFNILQTIDKGFVVSGSQSSFGSGTNDYYMIKFDLLGNYEWEVAYGGAQVEHGSVHFQLANYDYLMVGHTKSFGFGQRNGYIIRLDSSGNKLWEKVYSIGSLDEGFAHAISTTDNSFLLAGITNNFGAGNQDIWLVKTDTSGNLLWSKTYGGSNYDLCSSVIETRDKGFLINGFVGNLGHGGNDISIIKIDSVGNVEWAKAYGTTQNESSGVSTKTIAHTNDDGLIFVGWSNGFGLGGNDIFIVKTDSNGYSSCAIKCINIVEGTPTVTVTVPTSGTSSGFNFVNPTTISNNWNVIDTSICLVAASGILIDTAICVFDAVQLDLSLDTTSVFDWTPGIYLSDSTIFNPLATPASSTTYQVIVTDTNCGETDTFQVIINVNPLPIINLTPDTLICTYDSIILNASGGGTYVWSPTNSLSCATCPNPQATPPVTTAYTVIVTDTNNCVSIDSITIQVAPFVIAAAGPDTSICFGDSATLMGSGGNNFTWTPSAGLSDSTIANPKASPAVSTTYILEITDSLGCSEFDTVEVLVYPITTISAQPDTTVCDGSNVQLLSTGGNTYSWTPTANLSCSTCPNPVASPTATTTYYVIVTDTNNCNRTDSVTVIIDPPIVGTAFTDTTICKGESVLIHALGGQTYLWSPVATLDNPNLQSPTATPVNTTSYNVIINDTSTVCPPDTQTVTVTIAAVAIVDAGLSVTITPGSITTLNATGTGSFTWSPATGLNCTNCQSPIATPSVTTTYTVTITNQFGCKNSDTVTVFIVEDANCVEDMFFIPNAFTPNNDKNNDELLVFADNSMELVRFMIYNRWGNQVFYTEDITQGWDGSFGGNSMNAGVFVYYLEIRCANDEILIRKGDITLIR